MTYDRLTDIIKNYSLLSIIGMSKNVGKTTVLNYIINKLNKENIKLALTSIGRDGEDTDVVTNTEKPTIYVKNGTLIATARQCLGYCDITREILSTTGINSSMGEIIITRALSDGYVDLGGPSLNSQMNLICSKLKSLGSDLVIVDGALSRRTVASPTITEATILSTGASLHKDINKVVDNTVHCVTLLSTPMIEDKNVYSVCSNLDDSYRVTFLYKNGEFKKLNSITSLSSSKEIIDNLNDSVSYIYIKGVVYDKLLNDLVKNCDISNLTIIIDDGTKLFIQKDTLNKFLYKGGALKVLEPINLLCVTCNPKSPYGYEFDKGIFLKLMREKISLPVFDVIGGD
ncbi:hypothetical protein [Clostridium frigidicarnis]|uniref:Uncharacterized protein n=1 Tax=Clostridium frigidicarnis TaxID=84698 RepID=A0A1I1A3H6_9CLOT|nr:hypothetical protein [Clostridium frigidicarnis]SFB32501.1 hypothetical protein SAMN04488528_102938 [Clostridium frigidicarnis]